MTLSELDNFASPEEPPVLTEIVKECIESDSENLFKNAHIANHPSANFQALVKRRISGKSWKRFQKNLKLRYQQLAAFTIVF